MRLRLRKLWIASLPMLICSCAPNRPGSADAKLLKGEQATAMDPTMLDPNRAADWLLAHTEGLRQAPQPLTVKFEGKFVAIKNDGTRFEPPILSGVSTMSSQGVTCQLNAGNQYTFSSEWSGNEMHQTCVDTSSGKVVEEYHGPFNSKNDPEFKVGFPKGVMVCGLADHLFRGWRVPERGLPIFLAELIRKADNAWSIGPNRYLYVVRDGFHIPPRTPQVQGGLYSAAHYLVLDANDPAGIVRWEEHGTQYSPPSALGNPLPPPPETAVEEQRTFVRTYTGK